MELQQIELNEQEQRILVHTLTGSTQDSPRRNWYAASQGHYAIPDLNNLVSKGLMEKGKKYQQTGHYYHSTAKGALAVNMPHIV